MFYVSPCLSTDPLVTCYIDRVDADPTDRDIKIGVAAVINITCEGRLCGPAVRHSLRDREVRGSIPGRVKPKTLKLVVAADPPSVWRYGFTVKSGRSGVRIM
ncbi:hypothetical protein ElyMa_006338200 [Elysia marginata]|uniref:Uncharacterized protein n=1 Tax=Elysia marginata TaxID=1093978 RepID=A0AAV4HKS0_9GAST|nr:hypothetical protein ElyMa_006338200 [Elysia marginata]